MPTQGQLIGIMLFVMIIGMLGYWLPVRDKDGWRRSTLSERKAWLSLIVAIYALYIFGMCIWISMRSGG